MIKAALFDLDGTLANTLPDLKITINLTRAHYGLPPVTEEDVLLHVNNHLGNYIRLMIPELCSDEKWEEALQIYYSFYDDHYLAETVPYPEMVETLARLKADGILLAVMSNKNHEHVTRIIEALFPNTFDAVWGVVPEVPAKPDPARAFLIAKDFGVEPCEMVYIGDSDLDMQTGVNGGMTPIGVSWGYRPPVCLRENGALYTPATAGEIYDIIKSIAVN